MVGEHIAVEPYRPGYRGLDPVLMDVRAVALRLKEPDPTAVEVAARAMVAYLPKKSVLVPMPNSRGELHPNYVLSASIAAMAKAVGKEASVAELVCQRLPRESSYARRQRGERGLLESEGMVLCRDAQLPQKAPIIFIDNVVTTGATFNSACRALGGVGTGLAYAYATRARKIPRSVQQTRNTAWSSVLRVLDAILPE